MECRQEQKYLIRYWGQDIMWLQGNGLFPPTSNMKQSMLFYPPYGFYQSGFFKNDFGGISPAQFMQHTIEKVGIDAIMDTMTGIYTTNTLTVALTGDTRSSISQITIYVADSMYTLNTVIYNGGVTYYSLETLEDTTVIDYFDRRNGQTVDIQLIDE